MVALSVSLTMNIGGSLSLASMAVPAAVLGAAEGGLSGAGSTLQLAAVTVLEFPDQASLTGTTTVEVDGSKTVAPPGFGTHSTGSFAVTSGPCAVSDGGRCVGRPGGYGPSEACEIAVGGGGGVLGECGVFDTAYDEITLPDGSTHDNSDCPVGAALPPGGSVGWTSSGTAQGTVGSNLDNGCAAKGLCGLPFSLDGLGGGRQICFA